MSELQGPRYFEAYIDYISLNLTLSSGGGKNREITLVDKFHYADLKAKYEKAVEALKEIKKWTNGPDSSAEECVNYEAGKILEELGEIK